MLPQQVQSQLEASTVWQNMFSVEHMLPTAFRNLL